MYVAPEGARKQGDLSNLDPSSTLKGEILPDLWERMGDLDRVRVLLANPESVSSSLLRDPDNLTTATEELKKILVAMDTVGKATDSLKDLLGIQPCNDVNYSFGGRSGPKQGTPIPISQMYLYHRIPEITYIASQQFTEVETVLREIERRNPDEARHQHIRRRHQEIVEALDAIRGNFQAPQRGQYGQVNRDTISDYRLVVAAGGDNHFLHAAQLHTDKNSNIPILAIRTPGSEGNLIPCAHELTRQYLDMIEAGNYVLVPWTRIDFKVVAPSGSVGELVTAEGIALSEITFQSEDGGMFKRKGTGTDEMRGTGTHICTGTGLVAGGWPFNSLLGHPPKFNGEDIKPETPVMVRIDFGVYRKEAGYSIPHQVHCCGEEIVIEPTSKRDTLLRVDGVREVEVPRGSIVRMEISNQPLWVVQCPEGKLK